MAKRYYAYRDGKTDFPAGLLREALRDFRARHQCTPAEIVVCRGMAEKVRAALAEMGLGMSVQENGGVLWGEIWLAIPEETSDEVACGCEQLPRPAPDAGGDVLDQAGPGRQWMQSPLLTVEKMP